MKKLITLVMLGIMTVLNVNAEETTLWEGDWWFSWEAANNDEAHKGWNANSNGVNFTAYKEGDVFYFYLVKDSEHLFDNEYYNYRFDDSNWKVLPGCAVTDASGNETKAKFVLTADIKTALASADFALHGHGLKLVKVTKGEEEQPVVVEEDLWTGDYNVDWGLPDDDPHREWGGGEGQDVTANFVTGAKIFVYLTVAGTDYHKCQFDNWDWKALPGISPAEFSEDTKVTIEVTDDIAAAVAEKGFRLHGQGFHVTKVSKAKTVSGTITPAGWASFSSSYPLDLNTISGGEAYYASAANGETVTLTPTTATVPAGEGLMIKGTPNATFTINVAASGTAIDGNLLKATDGNPVAKSPESGAGTYHYVFGYKKPAEEVTEYGFYNLAAATTVPAGKAYLEITSNGARALRISLGGITEVENIEAEPEAKAQEGKFIENGKLVIIKNGVKYNAAGAKLY